MDPRSILENYRDDARTSFRNYKRLAERAMDQVGNREFFEAPGPESNSIAIIVKHLAGNLRSRWTDLLTTDGEKPERRRDLEFEFRNEARADLMRDWERGWKVLFAAFGDLRPEDLGRTITIRGEPHTVAEALNRQLTHYAYHIGQIVYLAKQFRQSDWRTLSVPKGRSEEFGRYLAKRRAEGRAAQRGMEGALEFSREQSKTEEE